MNRLRFSFSLSIVTFAAAFAPTGCSSGSDSTSTESRSQQAALHACTNGATRVADDGCNDCECVNGEWQCTELACVPSSDPEQPPTVTPPVTPPATPPVTPPSPPTCDPDTEVSSDGPPPSCVPPAQTPPAQTPPASAVCKDGDEAPAADGCNWCWCDDNDWHCTELGCEG